MSNCPRCGEILYAYDAETMLCPSGCYSEGIARRHAADCKCSDCAPWCR